MSPTGRDGRWAGDLMAPRAARFLSRHRQAVVEAVFERSAYLRAGADFLFLSATDLPIGPLTLMIRPKPADWGDSAETRFTTHLVAGQPVVVETDRLILERMSIDLGQVRTWQPPQIDGVIDRPLALRAFGSALMQHDRLDGRSPLGACDPAEVLLPPGYRLVETVAELGDWLAAAEGPPPIALLGRGPGLTPAGDDVLCGVMLGLRLLAARETTLARLAAGLLEAAPERTTALSVACLNAAAEGLAAEPLLAVCAALVDPDAGRLADSVRRTLMVGESSGAAALAGLWLALGTAHGRS